MFIVSIPGIEKITSYMSTRIHISRDTHITVTPRDGGRKKAEREENSLNVISVFYLCNYQCKASGERRGMGLGLDIFQKFFVKCPAHGQIISVKCTKISLPLAAHSGKNTHKKQEHTK